MSRELALLVAAVALALALAPGRGAAQGLGQDCEFLPGTLNWTDRTTPSGTMTYVSRPRLRCSDGRYIEADSAVSFSASGYTQLLGNVYFQDATRSLRAERVDYYENLQRLDAERSVVITDRHSGNVMTGERLAYMRAMPPGRLREELTMSGGRPTATLHPPADSAASDAGAGSPYEVEADWIHMQGEALFRAQGDVIVDRDSLHAEADTLAYDREGGALDLRGNARLRQGELDLAGRSIEVMMPAEVIREVHAIEEAHLEGEEIDLDAHTIRIFMTDGAMDRLVAIGSRRVAGQREGAAAADRAPAGAAPRVGEADSSAGAAADSVVEDRAVARAQDLVMHADSLEVVAPGEVLERVHAIGRARAVSSARDSLNTPETPEMIRHDWIEGDTVVAHLRPDTSVAASEQAGGSGQAGGADRSRAYVLEVLEAMQGARTLYRMDPDSARVEDERGEPVLDPPGAEVARADTAAAAADSLGVEEAEPAPPLARLPVSYVEADRIRIEFVRGQVEFMYVTGLRQGLYLQPGTARGNRAARRPLP